MQVKVPQGEISFAATGDSFVNRRLPEGDDAVLKLADIIRQADVRFTNLETVVRGGEGSPHPQPGGTWASAPPSVLNDLKAYGFNLLAWATNHTLDYSDGGLTATRRHLDAHGFVHAGAGENLAAAGAPKYLECREGRVACIAATSTFHESWIAGEQRCDMLGRPGVNPLRYKTFVRVSEERLKQLKEIADTCGINAGHELSVQEGFAQADDATIVRLGANLFTRAEKGQKEGVTTHPQTRDLERILRSIDGARRQADLVVVSIHSHEMEGTRKDRPSQFLIEFARACIDGGAHAVIGHGPHILRGIEVYKNCPIFYSLGNFIFQNETVAVLPADFYEKYGLGPESVPADGFDARARDGKSGLALNPKVWHSVIASWKMAGGKLKEIELHPVKLGFGQARYRQGWPRLTDDETALQEIQTLSREFGTELTIRGGKGYWSAES